MLKNQRKIELGKRKPLTENLGAYLYNLRMLKNISREDIAKHLNLSPATIRNVENNVSHVPPMRLKVWLTFLDSMDHFDQLMVIIRSTKINRKFDYALNNPANEHLDRLIDAYERNSLSDTDIKILRMLAPYEYTQGDDLKETTSPDTKLLDCSKPVPKYGPRKKPKDKTPARLKMPRRD